MNIKNRIEKLESMTVRARRPYIIRVFVPARDGKPYRTENGIHRIHCGDRTWAGATANSSKILLREPGPKGHCTMIQRRKVWPLFTRTVFPQITGFTTSVRDQDVRRRR